MKTEIYNLIILDESGSMSGVCKQTISGCNETINTIIGAQEKFSDTQDHFVSIYAFQSGAKPSRYLLKNVPANTVKHITEKDYAPWGGTPLYDAVGSTLVDLKLTTDSREMAIGNVTIITDGYENSSQRYTRENVARMIDGLKEMGWSFNFIGANIDVQRAAADLSIENAMEFQQDDAGTRAMFERERRSRMSWAKRANDSVIEASRCMSASPVSKKKSREDLISSLKKAAKRYFDEDEA